MNNQKYLFIRRVLRISLDVIKVWTKDGTLNPSANVETWTELCVGFVDTTRISKKDFQKSKPARSTRY